MFSCLIQARPHKKKKFNKKRKLIITDEQIIVTDAKKNDFVRNNMHKDL